MKKISEWSFKGIYVVIYMTIMGLCYHFGEKSGNDVLINISTYMFYMLCGFFIVLFGVGVYNVYFKKDE